MKNLLFIILISLIIVGCNREENNERKALSHCADIKYIKNLNAYPQIIVNNTKRSEIIQALQTRGEAITEWEKENNTANDLMGSTKAKDKFDNLVDPINFELYGLFNSIIAEASNVQALNEKTMDWGIEQKKDDFFYYAEFHLECWNEYKRDNGYHSKEFIDKYLEWQKQDVSNLGKQSYEFLNELLKITSYTRYSKEFTEFFTKLMAILPPRN
tara:strand:+ start:69 stop:710 length:642 start_codon:yes stop_codon:yes gene_type:complete